VRARQPRNHLALESLREQHEGSLVESDVEIGDRDLLVERRARATETGDFERSQKRASQDVSESSFGQVNDFGEDVSVRATAPGSPT
jgi:hypothetical protein